MYTLIKAANWSMLNAYVCFYRRYGFFVKKLTRIIHCAQYMYEVHPTLNKGSDENTFSRLRGNGSYGTWLLRQRCLGWLGLRCAYIHVSKSSRTVVVTVSLWLKARLCIAGFCCKFNVDNCLGCRPIGGYSREKGVDRRNYVQRGIVQ